MNIDHLELAKIQFIFGEKHGKFPSCYPLLVRRVVPWNYNLGPSSSVPMGCHQVRMISNATDKAKTVAFSDCALFSRRKVYQLVMGIYGTLVIIPDTCDYAHLYVFFPALLETLMLF